MTPVICFYENDLLLWSDDYQHLECPYSQNPTLFLKKIQLEFPTQMKVIQVSFDYLEEQSQAAVLENLPAVAVYVFNSYKLIDKNVLSSSIENIPFDFTPAISKQDFIKKVKTIQQDIQSGRFYQVNLTSHFNSPISVPLQPYEIFKFYANKFKSDYSAFLPGSDFEILCYSPELFLEKKGTKIVTRPIKGTTQKEGQFDDLLKSEKEAAELSMIVDLLRNDLQSVCSDKVSVDNHRKELTLNYLTHTYSEISGPTEMTLPDILKKMLPAGSISGCPKKESVLAINEIETFRRHFYTGCIGWWKGSDFKLNLAIRSFLKQGDTLTYFSGCGIVYDSDPEKEWQEFLRKAKHLDLRDEF